MSSDPGGMVQYHFRNAIGGFFELPTATARSLLPPELQPVEPRHASGVLSVMAFDFHASPVGAYGELILSVLVSPHIEPGRPIPRSAFYPFQLATTTRAAREHAIERWHLPHYMQDIDLAWERAGGRITARAAGPDGPIVDLAVTEHAWSMVEHRYQSFMTDATDSYTATIIMAGQFSDHEEERGHIDIRSSVMADGMPTWDVATTPFRELWMKDGLQTFHPLQQLTSNAPR